MRFSYRECQQTIQTRLHEPAPGRIQLLTGPRQVGKTTLLLELARNEPTRSLYIAMDGPETALPGYWEQLWVRVERMAKQGVAWLLLDEVQYLDDWSIKLKNAWDRTQREGLQIHMVASGSSALQLGSGAKESLAGRWEGLQLTHWSAQDMMDAFRVPPEEAAYAVVQTGGYPGAFSLRHDALRWAAYVREAIVEPAIGRDLLAVHQIRRPALLRQLFAVCATSPSQIVSLQKMQGQLQGDGALDTLAHYLRVLQEAELVAGLEKYATTGMRRKNAPPKLVPLNNALLAVTDSRGIPSSATDPARWGMWVENACLAHAWNRGQTVTYWREEPWEVDGILEGTWGTWALEVKTGTFTSIDLRGLLEFARRHPTFRPLVLCDPGMESTARRAGVDAMPWPTFLCKKSLEEQSTSLSER